MSEDAPWSSKHIIDMLCPSLEESGNPVVCYPVAGYPLGVKAKWEPMQDGSGTPSPENIRPIKGRDSVTVERCGGNLLKLAEGMPESDCDKFFENTTKRIIKPGTYVLGLTSNNYTSASQVSGVNFFEGGISFHAGSIGYGIGIGVHLVPGAKYKILYETESGMIYTSFYDLHGAYISSTNAKIFEVPANAAYMCELFRSGAGGKIDLKFENVAIVLDGLAESYTPYIGQTNTLTLPETVYGGEVDAATGEGQETWKTITLDGTEALSNNGTVASRKEQQWAAYGIIKHYPGTFGISSHFDSIKGSLVYPFNYIRISDTSIVFHVASDGPFATVADLKAYLAAQYAAGTPVKIAYKLEEPIPFTATGAQPIPALAGANTVLTDADSATVTGRADPFKKITDLEDAVASIN